MNRPTDRDVLAAVARQYQQARQNPAAGPIRAPAKPKRNQPCPCGSGQKFKRCCDKGFPFSFL